VGSLLLSLWSAASGVDALMEGVNAAYGLEETRSWLKRRWMAIRFTLALSAFVVITIGAITALPLLVEHFFGLGSAASNLISILRWPALAFAVMLGLSELYRLAPNRPPPRPRQLLAGTVLGTVVWLVASLLFSVYASSFGRFNKTYGVFGGFVVLLFWLWVSAMAILLGGELNAELEADRSGHKRLGARSSGERAHQG
jgi:membrane protein